MPAQRPTVARTTASTGPIVKSRTDAKPQTTQPATVKAPADGQATANTTASKDVDVTKCDFSKKSAAGRTQTCKLGAHGPETEHKFRLAGDKSKDMSLREAVGSDFSLDDEDVAPGSEVVQVKETIRDDDQKWFDAKTKESYDKWVAAGKPSAFNDSPRKKVVIPPAAVSGVRKLLDRAGAHHDKRVRIAQPVTQEDGNVALYYVMTDRLPARDKKGSNKNSTTENA